MPILFLNAKSIICNACRSLASNIHPSPLSRYTSYTLSLSLLSLSSFFII
jgi:hypothetical protein